MGLFDNTDNDSRDEVRVNVSEDRQKDASGGDRGGSLRSEVESKVASDTSSPDPSGSRTSKSSVGLEDIYDQNRRIIELLEEMSDGGRSSGGTKRVTDRDKSQDNESDIGSGMDELL